MKKQIERTISHIRDLERKLNDADNNLKIGSQVYNMNSENSELALVKFMELFNHSSVSITKRYLGLRKEDILETYNYLSI